MTLDPGRGADPPVYELFRAGMAFLREGHPHQAVMYLTRAKQVEPEKASIREALGRALYMVGRMPSARREFAKAVALDPASDYGHFALALACERTGQPQRAIGHLKLALVMSPGVDDYRVALGRLAG